MTTRKDVERLKAFYGNDSLANGVTVGMAFDDLLQAIDTLREGLAFYAKWLPECEYEEGECIEHMLVAQLAIDGGGFAKQALSSTDALKKE
jgi:hypothetical protein